MSTIFEKVSYGNYSLRDIVGIPLPLDTIQDDNSDRFACMDAPVNTSTHITTEMFEEGTTDMKIFSNTPSLSKYGDEYTDIKEFMAKPMLIYQTTWNHTDAANAVINTPNSFIGTFMNSVAPWAHKLEGFTLCRGTAKLRLVLNATPFQAGMLLLHFLPGDQMLTTNLTMYNISLALKVQQPGIAISCRDTAVELTIPYVNPFDWYNLTNSTNDWGQWFISVLSPLVVDAAGPQTADITVYLSFEDFEVAAPACIQGKKITGRKVSKAEQESEALQSGGPITKALRVANEVADALTVVPLLNYWAQPVAWATDLAAGIASWFGFSKPTQNTAAMYTIHQNNRYEITTDGADPGIPLAYRSDNRLRILTDVTGRPDDEMCFEFLKRVEVLALPGATSANSYSLFWVTNQASGTNLAGNPMLLTPLNLRVTGSTTDGAHVSGWAVGGPIAYLAPYFSHWRGSFRVRMKFVKTQFHTGRLQITWTPGHNVINAPDLNTSILSLREIVDISICDEVMFELPYLLDAPYCATYTGNDSYYTSGRFDVIVLNELRAPETVSSIVEILLFWSGGDDFEFNGGALTSEMWQPAYQAHSKSLIPHIDPECNLGSMGDSKSMPHIVDFSASCFGEAFVSVKQILARYYPIFVPSVANKNALYYPWGSSIQASTSSGITIPAVFGDPYNNIAVMYRLFRGGARVGFYIPDISGGQDIVLGTLVNVNCFGPTDSTFVLKNLATAGGTTLGPVVNSNATHHADPQNNHFYQIPYMNKLRASYVVPDSINDAWVADSTKSQSALYINTVNNNLSAFTLTRSFNDDFQLSYFIGCPPVMISHT